ncbi:hypothetical protein, partial [Pseudomonas syringae group genomosp. 7]|uniref:hypothetical protein n=1 Tax=Pseudomonas syringae group genomosp. 7 TaxID=251699 RepID=UPI00376F858C
MGGLLWGWWVLCSVAGMWVVFLVLCVVGVLVVVVRCWGWAFCGFFGAWWCFVVGLVFSCSLGGSCVLLV